MDIYIGNIPKGTRPAELKKLLKDSVRESVFTRLFDQLLASGRFDDNVEIDIVKRKRFRKHGYYRYGHLTIHSDRIAPVALEALKERKIRGSELEVRVFSDRNPENDRRSPDWRDKPWNRRSRRKGERREKAHNTKTAFKR
ncbi:MAG: RNA-binding protein [Gammaproteobacteria bacterium]|jgi:hypothetical protein